MKHLFGLTSSFRQSHDTSLNLTTQAECNIVHSQLEVISSKSFPQEVLKMGVLYKPSMLSMDDILVCILVYRFDIRIFQFQDIGLKKL